MKFEFRPLREAALPLLKASFVRAGEIVTPDGRALLMRIVR